MFSGTRSVHPHPLGGSLYPSATPSSPRGLLLPGAPAGQGPAPCTASPPGLSNEPLRSVKIVSEGQIAAETSPGWMQSERGVAGVLPAAGEARTPGATAGTECEEVGFLGILPAQPGGFNRVFFSPS